VSAGIASADGDDAMVLDAMVARARMRRNRKETHEEMEMEREEE